MDNNIYQSAIEQLVMEGFKILQIVEPATNSVMYFSVYKFQEGYFNTAQSIDFNTVEGVNITDFLRKNSSFCNNRTTFITNFNKYMEDSICIRCEFSKSILWYEWTSPLSK